MPKPVIHPHCRKCDSLLAEEDIEEIEKQINSLSYPTGSSMSFGTWHGLCQKCKDVNDFVVS